MNKTEMIAAMAETSGLSKKDCEAALTAFLTATESALKSGDKVQLVGFRLFRGQRARRPHRQESLYRSRDQHPRVQGTYLQARKGSQGRNPVN